LCSKRGLETRSSLIYIVVELESLESQYKINAF
jgi:hypothetical protein